MKGIFTALAILFNIAPNIADGELWAVVIHLHIFIELFSSAVVEFFRSLMIFGVSMYPEMVVFSVCKMTCCLLSSASMIMCFRCCSIICEFCMRVGNGCISCVACSRWCVHCDTYVVQMSA